jgi:sporulation protein YlmC with PRC-barrel domain
MGTAGSTAGSSSTMGTSGSSPNMASNNATQSLQPGQFLASDLIGTRVVGQNNDSIGDVNDVVMGQDGKAMMLVVGVGGFLGIGEKDVAIPFEQAQIRFDAGETRGAGNAGAPNTTGSTGGTPATGGTGGGSNATTGSSGAQQSASSNEPQRIVINMTKEQLQQAPSFRTSGASDNNASGNAGSRPGGATGTGTGTGTGNTNRP